MTGTPAATDGGGTGGSRHPVAKGDALSNGQCERSHGHLRDGAKFIGRLRLISADR